MNQGTANQTVIVMRSDFAGRDPFVLWDDLKRAVHAGASGSDGRLSAHVQLFCLSVAIKQNTHTYICMCIVGSVFYFYVFHSLLIVG